MIFINNKIENLIQNIEKVIVGKNEVIIQTVTAMLAGGHILIEDVPGVGKTQLAVALSKSVNGEFNRIQFTPDIMPADVTGFSMPNPITKEFEYKKGGAVCNFLLADEINRASPKAQSSLLEIMEERQISIDGATHKLPEPFMVLATQNPVETYGTYHLPEAQMDRFLMKISIGYPDLREEIAILDRTERANPSDSLGSVMTTDDICTLIEEVKNVKAVTAVKQYLVQITEATRRSEHISLGASPRGSIALYKCAKAYAFIQGRGFITPDDIKAVSIPVLTHRITLSAIGKSTFKTKEEAIEKIVSSVSVPIA